MHNHEWETLNKQDNSFQLERITTETISSGFLHDINMQDKENKRVVTRAEWVLLTCDTLLLHTLTFSRPSHPAHPVSCHSFPAAVTPVRPVSLLGDRLSVLSTHTRWFICLFLCLCRFIFPSLPSCCPSSSLCSQNIPPV